MAPIKQTVQFGHISQEPSAFLLDAVSRILALIPEGQINLRDQETEHLVGASSLSQIPCAPAQLALSSTQAKSLQIDHVSTLAKRHGNLESRQEYVFAPPLSYDFSGPMPGTVVGIVLGVTGGIILIVILFWAAFAVGGSEGEVVVVANSDASHSDYLRSRRSRRRRSSKYEMHQRHSRSRSHSPAPPRRPRTERIIVQETRRTESRPPPVSVDPPLSPVRSHRVEGDDVVEVIEEQSEISSSIPPPKRKSKRSSGSYRVIDPDAYAGGNFAPRDIYDDRRRGKR